MIGIDIVDIRRFKKFYQKFNTKALERFLNKDEIVLSNLKIETLAGFFASKEAVSKALGTGIGKDLGFHQIRLYKSDQNAPYFTLPRSIIEKYDIVESSLSITHEKEYAIAVVYIKSNTNTQKKLYH